jgi:hypothetical protein
VKTYASIAELVADSSLVADVTVESQTQTTIGGIPFTLSSVAVDGVLRGTGAPNMLVVDQVGDTSASAGPLMASGGQYLVFLTPAPDGNYYIVGVGAGLFQDSGSAYARLDTESPALPASVSHAAMETLIQAVP